MVRLKANADIADIGARLFQFHYGTIKSLRPRSIINPYTQFQFHYGTIKSNNLEQYALTNSISIPLWYD